MAPSELVLQVLDRQVRRAHDHVRADDDDREVEAVASASTAPVARGSQRGSPTPKRASANETLASAATP